MALRRNILLFHQGALGDFVLTWPIAVGLARIYPQSRLFYVTHAGKGRLAERALRVEWADAEAGWHALFGDGETVLTDTPGRLLAGAHTVVGFLSASDSSWVENVKRIAPAADVRVIDPNPPGDWAGHATAFQLQQLASWPAAHAAAEQILRSIQSRGVGVTRPPDPRGVLIHPGSGSPAKNWPIERYLELISRLRESGESVRVLIGEVEEERWPADVLARLSQAASLHRPGSYVELMDALIASRVFVGNDSGPGHLAAILGVPTLTLFGPTDPIRWQPLGPRVNVLRRDPLDALGVEDVFAAL